MSWQLFLVLVFVCLVIFVTYFVTFSFLFFLPGFAVKVWQCFQAARVKRKPPGSTDLISRPVAIRPG